MTAPAPNGSPRPGAGRLRVRRGATLPFVCVMLTALVGGAALAVDLGTLYTTGAEAQAAADAAALAGARFLQLYAGYYGQYGPINSSTYGMGGVTAVSRVAGAPAQITDYGPINYDPATGAITQAASWSQAGGVQVTVAGTPRYVFASALGLTPPAVARKATAWLANVNGATCVRPLALPYTRFYEVGIVGHRSQDSSITRLNQVANEYSYAGVASLQPVYPWRNAPRGRTYTAIPQWEKESDAQPIWPSSGREVMGRWIPVNFGGGVGNVYSAFTSYVAAAPKSPSCQAASAQVGTDEVPLPKFSAPPSQDKANLLAAAETGFRALCRRPATGGTDAHCYDADNTVGVRVRVMLADSLPGTSSGGTFSVHTREVTMVRVMCYFTAPTDVCTPATIKDETSTNTPNTYWRMADSYTGYPAGTITVLLDGPTSLDMTSDVVLGTKPGITQRILLVK